MTTAVLVPLRDRICAPTADALALTAGADATVLTEVGLPVDVARNRLAARALALRPDVVVWCDADAVWEDAQLFDRLRSDVVRLGPRALVGVVHCRREPMARAAAALDAKDFAGSPLEPGRHFPKAPSDPAALLRVGFVGAHVWAHAVELLDALGSDPFALGPHDPSEDSAFARRVREAGGASYVDCSAVVLHYDEQRDAAYAPEQPPFRHIAGRWQPDPSWNGRAAVAVPRSYGNTVDTARRRYLVRAGLDVGAIAGHPAPMTSE